MQKYILSIDQGTSSSRAILFDRSGSIVSVAQKEFRQYFPQPDWVEHDAEEIWVTQSQVIEDTVLGAGYKQEQIAGIGITNQRETTVIWDRKSGRPIYNAIVWQDRRTSTYCDELRNRGLQEKIQGKTGLIIDPYFSATKIKWILDNVEGARRRANAGELAFGTIDCWLIWNLTGGEKHLTDVSNASRTMLFNIHNGEWDDELLELFNIPKSILPQVCPSSGIIGETHSGFSLPGIPISGTAGDQQAALFGQMCLEPGMVKNTYGTGCFLMLNTGDKPVASKNNLLTTIAWDIGDGIQYALEGSVFIAGAVVQWLRDGLGIVKSSSEIEELANTVEDNGGVCFVPAFTGLGAPHWDAYARGSIMGLSRGTTSGHIARAALEGIAFQIFDVLQAMQKDSGIPIKELRVDGGASKNDTMMQFQSDITGIPLIRPRVVETTALGAAFLAGLAVGYWNGIDDIKSRWEVDKTFEPKMKPERVKSLLNNWHRAVDRSKGWG